MLIKAIKIIFSLCIIAALAAYLFVFSNIILPWQKDEAIQTTLEWGGLAELPAKDEDMDIEKKGSMFTRQFIIKFTAPESEINNWIKQSKRLKNNTPKTQGPQKIYEIYPGEKESLGGMVKITCNTVTINMSWS